MKHFSPLDPRLRRPWARCAVLAATALCAACADGQTPATLPPAAAPPVAGPSVDSLVGDAACDSDAQCHTIGVGAKACGGPQRYLAWSSLRTDGAALRGAAEREARAARIAAEKSGLMSNCSVTVDPGAYCAPADPAGQPGAAAAGQAAAPLRQCRTRSPGSGTSKIY